MLSSQVINLGIDCSRTQFISGIHSHHFNKIFAEGKGLRKVLKAFDSI